MELIKNLEIEPFINMIWVSQNAKEIWLPIINRISQQIQELELLSVQTGDRLAAWQTVNVNKISDLTQKCLKMGLSAYAIKNVGAWGKGFAHKTPEIKLDKPVSAYCIITKDIQIAKEFEEAHRKGDHLKQAHFLGFPDCCAKFFKSIWPKYYDPIWQVAENFFNFLIDNHPDKSFDEKYKEAFRVLQKKRPIKTFSFNNAHPYSNPLLRYIGIRISFHIPCSFGCKKTIEMGKKRLRLLNKEDRARLIALLDIPIEWRAYRGVALVKTPIFYFKTNTIPCKEEHIIQLHNKFIPKEGVSGYTFPFNLVKS